MKTAWRVAAGLCFAHVVLMLAGLSQQRAPRFTDDPAAVVATYLSASPTPYYVGQFLSLLAFFAVLLLAPLLATLLRTETPSSRWLAGFVGAAGSAYAIITIAVSYAPAAAAFYAAHHGMSAEIVGGLDRLGTFGTAASIATLGLFTAAIGTAALASGALSRFIGWTGTLVGVWCTISVAGIGRGLIDYGMLVWLVWFVVLAAAMLRRARRAGRAVTPAPTAAAAVPAVAQAI